MGTNVLTEVARRADTMRRASQHSASPTASTDGCTSGRTAVLVTSALAWWVFGYPLTTPWIVASIAFVVGIALVIALYWRRYGMRVNEALAAGDAAAAAAILTDPTAVLLSRLENLAVAGIIVLMVLRPG